MTNIAVRDMYKRFFFSCICYSCIRRGGGAGRHYNPLAGQWTLLVATILQFRKSWKKGKKGRKKMNAFKNLLLFNEEEEEEEEEKDEIGRDV